MSVTPFVAETTIEVRFAETDAMGVVHHAAYIVWLEVGRTSYLQQRGHRYTDLFEANGLHLAVTELSARYHQPARYGDVVVVRCWLEALQSRAVLFGYTIHHAATHATLFSGTSRHICVDRAGRPARLPADLASWQT